MKTKESDKRCVRCGKPLWQHNPIANMCRDANGDWTRVFEERR